MFKFSKQVEEYLSIAGWYPGRNINIDLIIEALQKEGYVVSATVKYFLRQFGYLRIRFFLKNGAADIFHFDAAKAVGDVHPAWVKDDYSRRLNKINLCVIGQAYSNHLTLIMDDDGKLYGGYDDNLYFIGKTVEEGIEVICTNKEIKSIP